MASDVVMPRLGWTMETGRVVEWLKQDGEAVAAGDMLFSVESDKAIVEVEALDSGVLRIPTDTPIGVDAPVGAVLAYILGPGEEPPAAAAPAPTAAAVAATPTVGTVAARAAEGATTAGAEPAISPRARRVARELGVDWTGLTGSGAGGRIRERDVRAAAALAPASERVRATPSTRQLADAVGVDLERLAGRAGGRVSRADVAAAALGAPAAAPAVVAGADDVAVPMSPARRVTAARMSAAAHTVAPVTLTTEVDATELVRLQARLKDDLASSDEAAPSITAMLVKLTGGALAKHPDVNASLDGESIVRHARIDIGIAVDAERGLYVPVVRDVAGRSVFAVAADAARLIGAARAGTLPPNDMAGGTFTVTNLGMYGIDAFTPIINLPEAAVLGIGRIVARPVVVDEVTDEVAVRRMLTLSLTFDHRIVDGGPAARFLQTLCGMIARPLPWLMR